MMIGIAYLGITAHALASYTSFEGDCEVNCEDTKKFSTAI